MRSSKARAFSLVEILLVIVIIAILTGILLMGFSAVHAVDANAEAAKLMRSLQQLRSGWLAYYADTYEMLDDVGDHDVGSSVDKTLSEYMGASAADLIDRYGKIVIATPRIPHDNGEVIYIGFAGPWFSNANFGSRTAEIVESMQRILKDGGYGLYRQQGVGIRLYDGGQRILLRIK